MDNSIVPVRLVVKSMRDNGYKNTAYAIAELIDNSIQHGSSTVDLFCLERDMQLGGGNTVSRIVEIGILDNGNGMDADTLQKSLQFGNGTNLDKAAQTGIGKFGMGLPLSSISQAVRVDVWSWQSGVASALHTYIDVDEISDGKMSDVPTPLAEQLPEKWQEVAGSFGESGTLVVWSNLDRVLWRTGKTIIEHSEFLVGRMYRKFIHSGQVKIRATVYKETHLRTPTGFKEFLPNDPMYLMTNTSVSDILKERGLPDPMFEKLGGDDGYERRFLVKYKGESHDVIVRYSVATEATRKGRSPGALPHGKHAGGNIGVSLIRAGRELDLDTSWLITYDPRERWWGVEVEFPPALDEVFGVTNNKQFANNFKELGTLDLAEELESRGQSMSQFKEELEAEGDPKVYLFDIAKHIKKQLNIIRKNLKAQAARLERDPAAPRHAEVDNEAEKHATEVTETRKEDGYVGQSDRDDENKSTQEKFDDLVNEFTNDNIAEPEEVAKEIMEGEGERIKYQFIEANLESQAFFSVVPVGGKLIIKLNTSHPAYDQFVEILNDEIDPDESKDVLQKRLIDAKNGLKLLLMAWARYEDEEPDGKPKKAVRDARIEWGKMASAFMEIED